MGLESLFASVSNKINEEISSIKTRFSGEGTKVSSDKLDDILTLENGITRLQSDSQTIVSLMDDSFDIYNFTNDTVHLSDWKDRFPYRLSIVEVSSNTNSGYERIASFRLLINPQDVMITMPFAIKTTVTSRGILEEHNGIPLKQITINGTTGLNLTRPSNDRAQTDSSIAGALFGGTIDAASSFMKSIKSSKDQFTNAFNQSGTKIIVNQDGFDTKGTGYYQYHMFRIFLETYAKLKTASKGKGYRLVFEMHKDKQFYLVTPNNFVTKKSIASPLEYQYTMTMTAWGSIPLYGAKTTGPSTAVGGIARDIGTTRRLFNALKDLRKVTAKAKNIVSNARADVESNIFGPMNDVILLTKDILSIPLTVADLPKSLRSSFQTSVISNWDSLSRTSADLKALIDDKIQKIKEFNSGFNSAQPYLNSKITGAQDHYINDIFDNIEVIDAIDLSSLSPTSAQQSAVDQAIQNAQQITENDINDLINELQSLSDSLEPDIAVRAATDEEWDLLYSTQDTINSLYAFIADGTLRVSPASSNDAEFNVTRATTALDFWDANTSLNDIPFNKYQSKFSVPFPFKSSLEELARIYLSDATLWPDIVALNGLQAPYIDEDGFSYNFLSNGSSKTFNVDSNKNLYVGQIIYISSNAQVSIKRKIEAINEITTTNFQIIINGTSDLNLYLFTDNAKMKAYLPYTTNSMKQIFIPTNDVPSTDDIETKPITFIDDDIEFVKFSKIDLLLDSNFDLAITSDGFANLAYGKTNLLQAAKLKLATIAGSKLLDPTYGGGVEVGESVADINIDQIVSNINSSFESDGRFNAPSSMKIDMSGNVILMNILVSVKNNGGILPITIPLSS